MKYNVILLFRNVHVIQIFDERCCNFLRYYSKSRTRNPYEVLGLKSTCSRKDVKKAYIKLCKVLHPDIKPGDTSQHKKFIELNDAYNTLLNPEKGNNINIRADNNPDIFRKPSKRENNSENNWRSEKAYYERKEYQEYYHQYSKENVMPKNNKIANLWVITGCFILMIIGSALYITAYRYANNYTLEKVDGRSRRLSESYKDLRKNIENEDRTERFNNLKKKWSE